MFDPATYLPVAAIVAGYIIWLGVYEHHIDGRAFGSREVRRLVAISPILGLLWPITLTLVALCLIPPFQRWLLRLVSGKPQPTQADDQQEGRRG